MRGKGSGESELRPASSRLLHQQRRLPGGSYQKLTYRANVQRERKEAENLAMEYGYPYNGCGSNKEKRPPLKRGQLKLQIAKTLLGNLVPAGAGAANRERSFGR
ncbi:hypothetical protein C2845_PM08G30230 [Panicum miliaceum]|uniref:Uncharacterized protein n=1 Tax=Panicum miliaceum TaxID=4540 RepID=A0A3L6R272_PANMI|nr:hypothetical protein C2845_PM08G30230 [Panicum miliaceum]